MKHQVCGQMSKEIRSKDPNTMKDILKTLNINNFNFDETMNIHETIMSEFNNVLDIDFRDKYQSIFTKLAEIEQEIKTLDKSSDGGTISFLENQKYDLSKNFLKIFTNDTKNKKLSEEI
jgi:hypothetical protein